MKRWGLLKRQDPQQERHYLALRFKGGAHPAHRGNPKLSNRDGYGVRIQAEIGSRRLVRETRGGEGFSAQNSRTLILGLGNADTIDRLTISWPSGKRQRFEAITADQCLLIRETASDGEPEWTAVPY